MKVRMLQGLMEMPHMIQREQGSVYDVAPADGKAWVASGLAVPVEDTSAPPAGETTAAPAAAEDTSAPPAGETTALDGRAARAGRRGRA